MDGSTIITSDPVADHYNSNTDTTYTSRGETYIFDFNGSNMWERSELQPEAEDYAINFGWEVAISGTRAMVGVPGTLTEKKNGRLAESPFAMGVADLRSTAL